MFHSMPSIFDVAAYVLSRFPNENITAMKMQKLLYYIQAKYLVNHGTPLFEENFEAWANGPVCREYFLEHQGSYSIKSEPKGDETCLSALQKEVISEVLAHYGKKSAEALSQKTHREDPWKEARGNIEEGSYCRNIISKTSMENYYRQWGI